jgi:hypothetical protein
MSRLSLFAAALAAWAAATVWLSTVGQILFVCLGLVVAVAIAMAPLPRPAAVPVRAKRSQA